MAKEPYVKESPEAAYMQIASQLKKAHMGQVLTIGRSLNLERKTFLIATYIIQGRMKIEDLPSEDAIASIAILQLIHKEINCRKSTPGEDVAESKRKRPRISCYGGGDFFACGCEVPVNRVTGICMKQRN